MKSRAVVATAVGAPLEVLEIDVAPPGPGEVLIEVAASGVCHSDAAIHADPMTRFPVVLGHEGAGVVREIGAGVTNCKPGDHVIPLYTPECGSCPQCRDERTNYCVAVADSEYGAVMADGTTRFSVGGETVHHLGWCSTFSEFTVTPAISLVVIDDDIPLDIACLLGCGVPTGVGSVLFTAKAEPGDAVVVYGLGGVGLNALQGARLANAHPIIGVDINPAKAALAAMFGATDFVDASMSNPVEAVLQLTHGIGAVVAIESTGVSDVLAQAIASTRPGGSTTVLLSVPEGDAIVRIDPLDLLVGRQVVGSSFGSTKRADIKQFVDWYRSGDLLIDELITNRIGLDGVSSALDELGTGTTVRSVVTLRS